MLGKKQKKVLVIDDESSIAEMYGERLIQEGYDVLIADDGEKGIDFIFVKEPDFVLLDINLPKKNGLEVLALVRATPKTKDLPIIVLSAFPKAEFIEVVHSHGVVGFFNKAVTMPQEITSRINRVLFPK